MNGRANGVADGAGDGVDNGAADGGKPARGPSWLDFLAFVEAIEGKEADLAPVAAVCEVNEKGKGGDLLAEVELWPTSTLRQRINDEVEGPRLVFIRTRRTTGQWDVCGRHRVPAKRAASTTDAAVSMLVEQNKELREELREMRAALAKSREPEESTRDKVSSLRELSEVAEKMRGPPPRELPAPPPPKSVTEIFSEVKAAAEAIGYKRDEGRKADVVDSVAKTAITAFKELASDGQPLGNFLNAIAFGLKEKLTGDDE